MVVLSQGLCYGGLCYGCPVCPIQFVPLWREGVHYSLRSKLPGKPDIVLSRYKIAIFVDGCFWHRCPLHGSFPKTNRLFWEKKITRNVARDTEVNSLLASSGWKVIRVWEHEIKRSRKKVVEYILSLLHSHN
jgi:DNA mismatch endonuclease, patch repair protein